MEKAMPDTETQDAPEATMPPARKRATTPRKRAAAKKAAPVLVEEEETPLFDLDAAVAETAEDQETQPFDFSFGGKTWTMRPVVESDAKLMANLELSEIQQIMSYLRDLLGEEQWTAFPRLSYAAAMILIEQYAEFSTGESLGEYEAPTNS
jgi:hypothetical protein